MCKIEGYWNIVPKIKSVSFPMRGKMQAYGKAKDKNKGLRCRK